MNVWQRFTETARRVVFYAQEEAGKVGEQFVSTEHLLLALIRDETCGAGRVLSDMGIRPARVRAEIARQVVRGDSRTAQEMELSPRAKRVIDLAYDESRKMGHDYIGTEHLLLGILREGEGLAARVLLDLGADIERARKLVSSNAAETKGTDAPTNVVYLPQRNNTQRLSSKVGMSGVIVSEEERALVEVATDSATLLDILKVFQAMDGVGYQEILDEGRMLLLALETKVKCLSQSSTHRMSVRVCSGEYTGKVVWIFPSNFAATPMEKETFPPVL
jgi:hypothetical protein